jgi:hypothetical protein
MRIARIGYGVVLREETMGGWEVGDGRNKR